jgi:hypothetical protein
LPYIGVHALCFYGGLGMFLLTTYPIYFTVWKNKTYEERNEKSESALFVALIIAVIGCAIKMLSFINYSDNGIFALFVIGQLLVCFSISILFTVSVLVTKYLHQDAFSLVDTVGATALGLALATLIVHCLFSDNEKFFTKVEQC